MRVVKAITIIATPILCGWLLGTGMDAPNGWLKFGYAFCMVSVLMLATVIICREGKPR